MLMDVIALTPSDQDFLLPRIRPSIEDIPITPSWKPNASNLSKPGRPPPLTGVDLAPR